MMLETVVSRAALDVVGSVVGISVWQVRARKFVERQRGITYTVVLARGKKKILTCALQ
jgi:hypothetical protein